MHQRSRFLGIPALIILVLVFFPAVASASVASYEGLGSWIDRWDSHQWASPARTVRAMHRHGVDTLYLQARYEPGSARLARPGTTGRLLAEAHDRAIRVVAWYLPPLTDPEFEASRARRAARFTARNGEQFDAFALDIESVEVQDHERRNRRAVKVIRETREALGEAYPLGAIVPSPRGLELAGAWWPEFPFARIWQHASVMLPMCYYTYRVAGADETYRYTLQNIDLLQEKTGDTNVVMHVVGGLAGDSNYREGQAFTQAVLDRQAQGGDILGAGLYDYATMREGDWRAMELVP